MADDIAQQVQDLLQATDDFTGWYQQVMALNLNQALPVLLRIVQDEQEKRAERLQAVLIAGLLRDARSVDVLLATMHAADPVLRARCAEALGNIGVQDDRVVQALMHGLTDEDYFVRESCAEALGQLKRPEALSALAQMSTGDSVPSNRDVAEKAIQAIRGVT